VPPLGSLALMLAKRDWQRDQCLISWRVMINEHAEKLRVKYGYYPDFRSSACRLDPAGVDTNFYEPYPFGVCGSRRQTLTTARRHDAIPGRDKHRGGGIDRADPGVPHTLMARRS